MHTDGRNPERRKLLSVGTESECSHYTGTSTTIVPPYGCCDFVKGRNTKPLIAIITILLVGAIVTTVMLTLDHTGFWDKPQTVDRLWFAQTLTNRTGLYPVWFQYANPYHAPSAYNASNPHLYLYRSQYGAQWTTDAERYNYSTLITQSRLIYNFATAYNATNNISYLNAMKLGIDVLMDRFYDSAHGGFFYAINETANLHAEIIDTTKDSVAHCAVIHALSQAFLCLDQHPKFKALQTEYGNVLNRTLTVFEQYFYDEHDGLYTNLSRDWRVLNDSIADNVKSQLPLMNYLEALKQTYLVSKTSALLNTQEIQRIVVNLYAFMQSLLHPYSTQPVENNYYVLFEYYDWNWSQPLHVSGTNDVSLGNALKWSFLISYMIDQAVIVSNDEEPNREQAISFLSYALQLGYDAEFGKIQDMIHPPSPSTNPPYWVVCNTIKTLYYYWNYYDSDNDQQLLQKLQSIIAYYQQSYYDAVDGGIFYSKPNDLWKGNVSKIDYECVDMALYVAQITIY